MAYRGQGTKGWIWGEEQPNLVLSRPGRQIPTFETRLSTTEQTSRFCSPQNTDDRHGPQGAIACLQMCSASPLIQAHIVARYCMCAGGTLRHCVVRKVSYMHGSYARDVQSDTYGKMLTTNMRNMQMSGKVMVRRSTDPLEALVRDQCCHRLPCCSSSMTD